MACCTMATLVFCLCIHSWDQKNWYLEIERQGEKLLDYLNSIMGIIQEHLGMWQRTTPDSSKFSSINQLAQSFQNFTQYLRDNYYLIEANFNKEQTDIIVADLANMVNEMLRCQIDAWTLYLVDDNIPIPYQQVKKSLYNGDIKEVISLLNSIIKSIPYLIHKREIQWGIFPFFLPCCINVDWYASFIRSGYFRW